MTADLRITATAESTDQIATAASMDNGDESINQLPMEITAIFKYLSRNDKIIFRSQQKDEPDLNRIEKENIARELYMKNREKFLVRFGCYFNEWQLSDFERLSTQQLSRRNEKPEELQLLIMDLQRKLKTHKTSVKNRRYAAMQDLIQKGDYFSEQQMMKRAPELYQELVGQYMTTAEKKQRDSYDVRKTSFSSIIMHSLEQRQMEEILDRAEAHNMLEQLMVDISNESSVDNNVEELHESLTTEQPVNVEIPVDCRQQWGSFDNEQVACSTSEVQPVKALTEVLKQRRRLNERFITSGERELLRQEFIGIMHEQFLAGDDTDFDYSAVDENTQLDDLQQLDRDKEDAYFDESDDEAEVANEILQPQAGEESEDELDVYMQHLSKHHSLQ